METSVAEAGRSEVGSGRSVRSRAGMLTAGGAVVVTTAAWAAVFAVVAVLRHFQILTQRYDLGNMTQAVYNTAHGRWLEVTEVGGQQVSRLGIHVDPILVALAPLWWIWPSPLLLLIAQALALSLGALPVFWLARKHLASARAGAKFAIAYLLYPALQWNAVHEFHAVAFAVPLLLFAVWYLDEDRLVPFTIAAIPAALTKEQIGLIVAVLGIWYGVRSRRFRAGAGIATAAAGWTVFAVGIVIPHFAGGPTPYLSRYEHVGGTPWGIVRTAVTDPMRIVDAVTTPHDVVMMVFLGLPLLGLCFISPLMLAALPQLLLNMLSDRDADTVLTYQHALPLVPIAVAAAVLATARISRQPNAMAGRVLLASIAVAVIIGPIRFFPDYAQVAPEPEPAGHLAAQRAALRLIPDGAAVSATNRLGGQLADRRFIYVFPFVERADWIVADAHNAWLPAPGAAATEGFAVPVRDGFVQPGRLARIVDQLKRDRAWRLRSERTGVVVFQRVGSPAR